jgi:N-methylhydantoinase A
LIYWGDQQKKPTAIYRRDLLPCAALLRGPAIIEEPSTTIIVPMAFEASLDELGNIILQRS